MAITLEKIQAQEALADLTEDQIKAIVTLSANDENEVIGAKTGEIYGNLDKDILEASGVEKKEGERTFDYARRVVSKFKEQSSSVVQLQTKIDEQKKDIEDLHNQIKEGSSDQKLKQQLADAETKLVNLQTQYEADKTSWSEKEERLSKAVEQVQVDVVFEQAVSGVKFKAGITDSVQQILLKDAKASILSEYTPDWEDKDGQRKLIFRDKEGKIVTNPTNLQNAITIQELVSTKLKDVIDPGRTITGTGSRKTESQTPATLTDLRGAKNQVEADDAIESYLLAEGVERVSTDFVERFQQIRDENKVSELPIR